MPISPNSLVPQNMFNQLFKAEARIYFGKKWFYACLLFFLVIGYLMSILARFSFPGVYVNSPYTLTYAIGLVSLVNIFTITILSAQIVLREKDAGFDAILYTTPMPAKHFLLSRFSLILLITIISFFLFVTGFMAGHLLAGNNREKFMDFHVINYLYPFFVLAVPNALLCTAISKHSRMAHEKQDGHLFIRPLHLYPLHGGVAILQFTVVCQCFAGIGRNDVDNGKT